MKKRKQRIPWYPKEWMVHRSVRQVDIVNATGMGKGAVSEFVSGSRDWTPDSLAAFSKALGIEPWMLFLRPSVEHERLTTEVQRLSRAEAERVIAYIGGLRDAKNAA